MLLGLAGAVAGTAVAWALSTSAATAETGQDEDTGTAAESQVTRADLNPVADATVAGLRDVTTGAAELAGEGTGALAHGWHEVACDSGAVAPGCAAPGDTGGPVTDAASYRPREARHIEDQVSGQVSSAVTELAERAVLRPVHRVAGSVEHVVRQPEDAGQVLERTVTPPRDVREVGSAVLGLLDPQRPNDLIQLPDLPTLPGTGDERSTPETETPVTGPERGPGAVTVEVPPTSQHPLGDAVAGKARHLLAGSAAEVRQAGDSRNGSGPVQPLRLPAAPVTAPSVPGGTSGGGHLDGQLLGVPAGQLTALDTAVLGDVSPGTQNVSRQLGAQPGVTPD
ncbi:hypothetical protein FB471_3593 [Amycolatopsis cihanbeyliensis]|uniref:Uncharacterized protein n=1 Tax=Amycolatopsis cihanbeyliensis TaxID=1128664 RepID=A0A542DLI9_AMYCI|nr:hypothetical protein FB471_3593 [Amycolatopsis cihanbeyliensis]